MNPLVRRLTDTAARRMGAGASSDGLAEARKLMRSGRLMEATEALQRGLGTAGPTGAGPAFATRTSGPPSAGRATGSVTRGSFTGSAGTRGYRLFVPRGLAAGSPLMVMLHGGTQDAGTFATATGMDEIAEAEGFAVVYPEQSRSANPMGYWNWFRPGDQARGSGEPSLIAGITTTVAGEHAVDTARIAVAGFSAGAAMSAVMAATYPDLYAGAGVHSGLPFGAAHDAGSAFAAMSRPPTTVRDAGPVPLVVVHGDRDGTVAPANADAVVRAGLGAGHPRPEEHRDQVEGGRSWTRRRWSESSGRVVVESWTVHGLGHDWSGGRPGASYTDPTGPDASRAMATFFGFAQP